MEAVVEEQVHTSALEQASVVTAEADAVVEGVGAAVLVPAVNGDGFLESRSEESDVDPVEMMKRDSALALALAKEDFPVAVRSSFVRRSMRDPSLALLDRPDVQKMLRKIRENHHDTVVFKVKDNILSDINSLVMDEILHCLEKNEVCQALYVQNLERAIEDKQLRRLIEILKVRPIWCINIGETYHISKKSWDFFCKSLPETSVTHLYVSEHVIDMDMKNEMRENIRKNRKKHDMHCSLQNIKVIERCTNCWWNPINSIRHQLESSLQKSRPSNASLIDAAKTSESSKNAAKQKGKRRKPEAEGLPQHLSPKDVAFWAEGVGEGGAKPWKFRCLCGEVCSSRENPRYHPQGRMYECTRCSIWSHTDCVLGPEMSDNDIEELEEVLCSVCRTQTRRLKMEELRKMSLEWIDGLGIVSLADSAPINTSGDGVQQHVVSPPELASALVDVLEVADAQGVVEPTTNQPYLKRLKTDEAANETEVDDELFRDNSICI